MFILLFFFEKVFAIDDFLYVAYYAQGVAVYNISNPAFPNLLSTYDTSPIASGYSGVWGIYSFDERKERYSYASDIEEGLFLFSLDDYQEPVVTQEPDYLKLFLGFTTFLFGVGLVVCVIYIYKKRRSEIQFQHLNEANEIN